jgi:hypothetical protein
VLKPRSAAENGLAELAWFRVNAGMTIFAFDEDCAASQRVLSGALARDDVRLLAYFPMSNQLHLLLWPRDTYAFLASGAGSP